MAQIRGWTRKAIELLGVGLANTEEVAHYIRGYKGNPRIVLPVRDAQGELVNVLFYAPDPATRGDDAKVLALRGRRRDLFPAPETIPGNGDPVILVEGEPDALAGWSSGLRCVAIPGVGAWKDEWNIRLAGRRVVLCLDADAAGRERAAKAAEALVEHCTDVRVLDLAPLVPEGGKDLTDYLLRGKTEDERRQAARLFLEFAERTESIARPGPFRIQAVSARQFCADVPDIDISDDLLGPLLRRSQRVVVGAHTGEGKTTIALQMVRAALLGEDFLGWQGRNGGLRALIVDLEQGEQSVKIRLEEAGLDEREDVVVAHLPDGLELDKEDNEHMEALDELLSFGFDIVVLDPFYKLRSGEPKEEGDAVALMNLIDGWRRMHEFCLILPIHCRKPSVGSKFSIHDIFGWTAYVRNAEIIFGVERVSDGYSRLHWWKDREGRCQVPIPGNWGLLYNHEQLFWRDPNDDKDGPTVKQQVLEALGTVHPGGMTYTQLVETLEVSDSAVKHAVADLVKAERVELAGHEGRAKVWRIPLDGLEQEAA